MIHARHPRRPSRSRVSFALSISTFNRPVSISSESVRVSRGLQPLPHLGEHPIILTCYSLSPSTATPMDFSVLQTRNLRRATKLFRCNIYKNHGARWFPTLELANSFVFNRFRTLYPKTPAAAGPMLLRPLSLHRPELANSKIPALPGLAGYLCQRIRFQPVGCQPIQGEEGAHC